MTAGKAEGGLGGYSIGQVLQSALDVVAGNVSAFLILGLVCEGAPRFVMALLIEPHRPGLQAAAVAGVVISIISSIVLQASVTTASAAYLSGAPVTVRDSLRAVAPQILPLLGLGIVIFIGVTIGFMLLVVPGLFLAIVWSVATPAQVLEGRGVFGSLQRSTDLTRGRRWSILGLCLILFALLIVALLIEWIFASILALISVGTGGAASTPATLLKALLEAAYSSLIGVFSAACGAALFVRLRQDKDGAASDTLAAAFA